MIEINYSPWLIFGIWEVNLMETLFPIGSRWILDREPKKYLNAYDVKKSFIVVSFDGEGKIKCKTCRKTDYSNVHGSNMQCGCKFSLKFCHSRDIIPDFDFLHPRRKVYCSENLVSIETLNYNYINCCYSKQQELDFVCLRTGKYLAKVSIQVY